MPAAGGCAPDLPANPLCLAPTHPPPLLQGTVGIAFDLMSVNLADVPRLPAIVPALKLLFTEREQEEDDEEPEPAMLG